MQSEDTLRSISININRRCPLKCKHCSLGFSDSFEGDEIATTPEDLDRMIKSVDTDIYKMILLAGGEPSLSPHLIRSGIAACKEMELLSAIVTAPIWAPTAKTAAQFLTKIPGLDILILSYDDYHLEFLKLDHYRHAVLEAVKRGIRIVLQIAYTEEEEKEVLIQSLGGLKTFAFQINPMRTVMIGNALDTKFAVDEIEVNDVSALERIPRGCVLGNVFIDENFGLHGCCWSTASEMSPFSIVPDKGLSSLGSSFSQLEASQVFQSVRKNGFLDSLTDTGRQMVVDAVSGERFTSECDLCMRIMKKDTQHIWDECRCPSGDTRG